MGNTVSVWGRNEGSLIEARGAFCRLHLEADVELLYAEAEVDMGLSCSAKDTGQTSQQLRPSEAGTGGAGRVLAGGP